MEERAASLQKREEQLEKSWAAFRSERDKIAKLNASTSDIVEINCGGKILATTRSTLKKYDGTLLEAMFSGRHKMNTDRDGRVFIDRDPKYLRILLNLMRDPRSAIPRNMQDLEQLKVEADYFGIDLSLFAINIDACLASGGEFSTQMLPRNVENEDVTYTDFDISLSDQYYT